MASEPSFFSNFCCCSRETKEPPVTLIRSGLTPPPTEVHLPVNDLNGTTPHTSISPARDTVDGLVDEHKQDTEAAITQTHKTTKAPKWKASESTDEMNMNDVMMDELCANDDQEQRIEDAVSIRTNVIEEVNEDELRQMTEALEAKKEVKEEEGKEQIKVEVPVEQATSRSEECVSFSVMLKEGYDSPRLKETTEEEEEEEEEEERDIIEEEEEMKEIVAEESIPTVEVTAIANGDEEEDLTKEEVKETNSPDEVSDEDSEEILLADIPQLPDSSPPQPKPRSPQPPQTRVVNESPKNESSEEKPESPITPPKMSMMYAEVSSDEESSDDEAEREVLPPVERPEEDKTDVENNWEDRIEKENRVTRLSLKSNGQATMTTGAVRVTLDSVDMTDDEFSEKLI